MGAAGRAEVLGQRLQPCAAGGVIPAARRVGATRAGAAPAPPALEDPMLPALIIAVVVGASVGALVKHLRDLNALHPLVVPLMLVAGALPAWVSWQVLAPGPPVATARLSALHDEAQLELPPGTALMVTAELGLAPLEMKPEDQKTNYAIQVRGSGWEDALAGEIKRETDPEGPSIDPLGDPAVREQGQRRATRLGEDLQDRHDVSGAGAASLKVTNWSGKAARALVIEAVPAPLPSATLWIGVVVLTLAGLAIELRKNAESLASWLAFLSSWAVFLRDGVTPLDDWQEVAMALAPAGLFGFGAIAGLTYVAMKVMSLASPQEAPAPARSKAEVPPAAAPAAPAAPAPAAPPAPPAPPAEAPAVAPPPEAPAAAAAEAPAAAPPADAEPGLVEAPRGRRGGAAARRRAQTGGEGDEPA